MRSSHALMCLVLLGTVPGCDCGGPEVPRDGDVLDGAALDGAVGVLDGALLDVGVLDGAPLDSTTDVGVLDGALDGSAHNDDAAVLDASLDGALGDQAALDLGTDPLACTQPGTSSVVRVAEVDAIDLLFMVDNSASMREEQEALVAELPRMVEVLASGDRDDDGTQDFRPVASIHVGVITSDMGIGGTPIPPSAFCGTVLGDDGVMLTEHRGTNASCAPSYPSFLEFMVSSDDPAAFAESAGCLAGTGGLGCAFEQQLEAILKALTPADSSVVFEQTRGGTLVRSTRGHGGTGANAGFLRDTSLLALILVSDEDDCSSPDLDLYDVISANPRYPVPRANDGNPSPNLQCTAYREVQYEVIKRYVGGLLELRPDFRDLLLFAAIVGVAPEVVAANTTTTTVDGHTFVDTDYAAILADPSMLEAPNPSATNLVPGCTRPNPNGVGPRNEAYPPRRIVDVARGLDQAGAHGVVASICQSRDPDQGDFRADFTPAVDSILLAIENALPVGCTEDLLARRAGGEVNCEVLERLPAGVSCASQAGRGRDAVPVRVEGSGPSAREVCRVRQLVPTSADLGQQRSPSGAGWFYDDYTSTLPARCPPDHQAIVFTPGAEVTVDAQMTMECLSEPPAGVSRADVGTGCVVNPRACELGGADLQSLRAQYRRPDATLVCAPSGNCHLACTSEADCPGLMRCETIAGQSLCVDPSCAP